MIHPYRLKAYLWVLIAIIFIAIACLSGCSTVAGVGTDIKNAADWTHDKMTGDSK